MRISKDNVEWAEARKEQLGDKYGYALLKGNPHGTDDYLWDREKEEEFQGSKLDKLPDYPEAEAPAEKAPAQEAEPVETKHSPEIQQAKERVTAYQKKATGEDTSNQIFKSDTYTPDTDKYNFTAQ